ncbi:pathogenicity island protein [Breoghania sp. JC706]|uniref:pathogenicity island protein n=1 Tax=Breoghania sp. JC706 TaxID=3117732 RepID=UPI003008BEAC
METLFGQKVETLPEDVAIQLWNGALRDELGLKSGDLQIALGVANMKNRSGNTLTALRIYMALVLCDPSNFECLQGLANCALQNGLYEAALEAGSAMVVLKPRNPLGYYFSGTACLAMGHLAEAREDIVEALNFAGTDEHRTLRGECERLLKQLELRKSA